jgi:glycosyltransferase involved in cell wall biosynthesis
MRIVHLVARSHRRGAEVVALELAAALTDLGHENEVQAIARSAEGSSVAALPVLVPTSRLGLLTYVRCARQLRKHLALHPADLVLAHGGSSAVVAALGGVPRSTARVWQRILGFPVDDWGRLRRRWWATVLGRFDGVVTMTAQMDAEVRDLGYTGPVWHVPNARNPERFADIDRAAASAALRAEIGVDDDVPLLGFVGHLVDQKQPEMAVEVLADVRREGHPAHLVMAGDGARRRSVERRIEALGVEKAVTLLGHRDDPELIFGGVDLLLITSAAEGIPGVAIEAQMTGCPVVTFLLGAVTDVVDDGVTGAVVPWPDPLLMASRVSALLRDPVGLRAMGAAAIEPVAQFTTAVTAALYEARFTELERDRAAARGATSPDPG